MRFWTVFNASGETRVRKWESTESRTHVAFVFFMSFVDNKKNMEYDQPYP